MNPIVMALPGNETVAAALASCLGVPAGRPCLRPFPDGETYVRYEDELSGRRVFLVCSLDRADRRFIPLALSAGVARECGATEVGLVAPYLGYLRQDARFRPGEGITSRHFARLLSTTVDWLVTVDPHLHRHRSLADVYEVPASAVAAAPAVAAWIREHVAAPVLIGPDGESEQWVAAVAGRLGAPYAVFEKIRRGDREVELRPPDLPEAGGRTPVLLDDVISTARTMAQAAQVLRGAGWPAPLVVGVHGVFADGARRSLREAGVTQVVTTNTIPTPESVIDVAPLLARGIAHRLLDSPVPSAAAPRVGVAEQHGRGFALPAQEDQG